MRTIYELARSIANDPQELRQLAKIERGSPKARPQTGFHMKTAEMRLARSEALKRLWLKPDFRANMSRIAREKALTPVGRAHLDLIRAKSQFVRRKRP